MAFRIAESSEFTSYRGDQKVMHYSAAYVAMRDFLAANRAFLTAKQHDEPPGFAERYELDLRRAAGRLIEALTDHYDGHPPAYMYWGLSGDLVQIDGAEITVTRVPDYIDLYRIDPIDQPAPEVSA
jgi:hypothetical protein